MGKDSCFLKAAAAEGSHWKMLDKGGPAKREENVQKLYAAILACSTTTSHKQIKEYLGLKGSVESATKQVLKDMRRHYSSETTDTLNPPTIGTKFSVQKLPHKELADFLRDTNLNDTIIQVCLNLVDYNFYMWDRRGNPPVLKTVAALARECMLLYPYLKSPIFLQALQESGIPIRTIEKVVKSGKQAGISRYHFIAAQHTPRGHEALLNTTSLRPYRSYFINIVSNERSWERPVE